MIDAKHSLTHTNKGQKFTKGSQQKKQWYKFKQNQNAAK